MFQALTGANKVHDILQGGKGARGVRVGRTEYQLPIPIDDTKKENFHTHVSLASHPKGNPSLPPTHRDLLLVSSCVAFIWDRHVKV